LSVNPALRLCAVPGAQIVPAEVAVVPPTRSDFSQSKTSRPSSALTKAAAIPPAPAPTTSTSTSTGPCDALGVTIGIFPHGLPRVIEHLVGGPPSLFLVGVMRLECLLGHIRPECIESSLDVGKKRPVVRRLISWYFTQGSIPIRSKCFGPKHGDPDRAEAVVIHVTREHGALF